MSSKKYWITMHAMQERVREFNKAIAEAKGFHEEINARRVLELYLRAVTLLMGSIANGSPITAGSIEILDKNHPDAKEPPLWERLQVRNKRETPQ
jgi:hypothetical protein